MPSSNLDEKLWFDSWDEFLEAAEQGTSIMEPEKRSSRQAFEPGSKLAIDKGTATWDEARELAHEGWLAPLHHVQDVVDNLKVKIAPSMVDTFTWQYDVSGSAVDIDRFLLGEPENLVEIRTVKTAKPGRVIRIHVHGGYMSDVSPTWVMERGIALCALIELLERAQHNTEVFVEAASYGSSEDHHHSTIVRVKGTDERLDMGRLLFATAHASFFRRYIFSLREQLPTITKLRQCRIPGGYGHTEESRRKDEVAGTIYVPHLTGRNILRSAEEWVEQHLRDFGLLDEAHA